MHLISAVLSPWKGLLNSAHAIIQSLTCIWWNSGAVGLPPYLAVRRLLVLSVHSWIFSGNSGFFTESKNRHECKFR